MHLFKSLGCAVISLLGLSYARPTSSGEIHLSITDIPRFLTQNLSTIEVRDGIRAMDGKSITAGLGETLNLCHIEIVQSYMYEKSQLDNPTTMSYAPHDILFEIQTICADDASSTINRQCTKNRLIDNGSFELIRLRGRPEGCPSGKSLLELHERIGRQIGSRVSTLLDGSEYELFRNQNEEMSLRIRSTLYNVLFKQDSLQSFYSQFG